MTIDGIGYEPLWLNSDLDQVCEIDIVHKSKKFGLLVLVKPLRNMDHFKQFRGRIPFPLESFLNKYEPLTESML